MVLILPKAPSILLQRTTATSGNQPLTDPPDITLLGAEEPFDPGNVRLFFGAFEYFL